MGDGYFFPEAIDVIADVCRDTPGAELIVLADAPRHGARWTSGPATFTPDGSMNHHTGRGGWVPLLNFMRHGSSIAPLCNGATSNPHETDGKVIVAVVACGRANHAGRGVWAPGAVPTNGGNRLLWGWEHQHPGDATPWHVLHREVILRLNAAMCLAFGWPVANTPDHKDYAPGRKVDRAHENGAAWRAMVANRISIGHHTGHRPKERAVATKRIGGAGRHDTAAMLARTAWGEDHRGGLAFLLATDTPDADAVANVARMGPILTVDRDTLPPATARELARFKPDEVIAIGGTAAISDQVLQAARDAAR